MSRDHHQFSIRHLIRQTGTFVFTLFCIALAIGVMILAQSILASRADAVAAPDAAAPLHVETAPLHIQNGYNKQRGFPGQIEAAQTTQLAFESGGTLIQLAVKEGHSVKRSDVIARLDTRLIRAEESRLLANRRALSAQAELAQRTQKRQKNLNARGFASDQRVDDISLRLVEITARIAEIDAALVSVRLTLEKATLTAPFDAIVGQRMVDTGGAVGAGQAIVSLVEIETPTFRTGVPNDVLAALMNSGLVNIEFGSRTFKAQLERVLPELDHLTRTRTAILRFAQGDVPPFGEIGRLVLPEYVSEQGAWVPLAALRDGPRGLWRIMTLNAQGTAVQTEAVNVLYTQQDRAFIAGTFGQGARYITDGPHRVVPGQSVTRSKGAP